MKKVLLLIPLFIFAMITNAAVINITTTSPHSSNNLLQALNAAETGDIIEMAAGTYVENNNWLAVEDKEVTVRAAEGAEVIIKPKFSVRVKAPNAAAKIEFIGVKFDCSTTTSSELFVASDDNANQKVVLTNCEFYGWPNNSAMIRSKSDRRLDVIDISNCYFHDCEKSIVFIENTNLVRLHITNSTFANVAASITDAYWAAPIYVKAPTTGDVEIDHCTFYNVNSMSLSYGTITVDAIATPVVSNCIFMLTASADMCATNLKAGGNVKNCLTFNYDNWQPYGHYTTATVTDCVKANPLFKNAAGGDFSLYAGSKARGAGDDDSDLGDPRWYTTLTPTAIPATLVPFDALLSDKASIIQATPDSIFLQTESEEIIEWAKWNVSMSKSGLYNFKAFAKRTSPSGSQKLQISVQNSAETETLITNLDNSLSTDATISSGNVNLTAGNTYVIKVFNNYPWAKSKLIKVEATYEGGAVVNAPGEILAVEAVIYDNGYKKMFHNANGDLEYGNSSTPSGEYAYWNINATEAGEMAVSFNSPSGGHNFLFELYEGTTLLGSVSEEGTDAIWEHNVTLANHLTIPAAGTYTLRVHNRTQWSSAILHSVTIAPYVAPSSVVMIDTDTDNTRWIADLNNTVDVQMTRTILGGMYNTICLPFKVSSTQCKAIFGNDVELYTLGSATISGDILNLQFNTASDIWNGTPILIKTSSDIVNPVFEGVTIESETGDHTDGGAVVFRSTFVQKEFHNGDQVLLLVANNMLAYPLSDRTLKGFRAYFEVKDTPSGAPIRSARIIAGEQVVTDIDLVEMQEDGMGKMIENGQVIIIRNGVRYNALGVEVK